MLTDLLKYTGYWQVFNTELYLNYLRAKIALEEVNHEPKSRANENIQIKK